MRKIKNSPRFYFVTYRYWKKSFFDQPYGSNYHSFRYLAKGKGKLIVGQQTIELEEGDLFYLPRSFPYQAYIKGDEYAELIVYGTLVFPEAQAVTYNPPYWAKAKKGEKPYQTVPLAFGPQKLPRELAQQLLVIPRDTATDTHALSLFFSWLDRALPHMQAEPKHTGVRLAEQALAYMQKNPGCKIPEVAHHCGISEPTLYSHIHRVTGRTPNQLRQEILVKQAIELLTTTDMSVNDISDALMFSSPNYFRKMLKDYTGQSPSSLRKSEQADLQYQK